MPFFAHTENLAGQWHPLCDHLRSVGALAKQFAEAANPALAEAAEWAGLLHDLGKYRDEFQQYLRQQLDSGIDTHHAIYGAAKAFQQGWLGPAFAIAGHHAGLHNLSQLQSLIQSSHYKIPERLSPVVARFEKELGPIVEKICEPEYVANNDVCAEFYVRMLFSALVDADFLDTEAHYTAKFRNSPTFHPSELLQLLIEDKETKSRDGELNAIRNRIFQRCLDAAESAPGFFSLTVPTGGGKTLSAMAFALAHAYHHGLRRVIAVIPYLSIIEQNAGEYRRILDPQNRGVVIEHHSAVLVPEDSQESRPVEPFEKHLSEYAAENWDVPVVVTTSVQFIESLFSSRTSACRKLHNIAGSIVLLDEVQTLPSHLLNPLLNVFRDLRDHYGTSFLFCTATQPAFTQRPSLTEGFQPGEVKEITQDTAVTFSQLRRVNFHFPQGGEVVDWTTLAQEIADERQVLCIVNVRRHAFELWEALCHALPSDQLDSVFHLSSAMCAEHRLNVLEEVRGRLDPKLKEPCRVVSTQLVEAGVDLDFPLVYRALGPLDSIVQAAGRCNREGRLPELGEVVVFRPIENSLPAGVYRTATNLTATLLEGNATTALATDPALFAHYFDQLYQYVPTDYERRRESPIQEDRKALRFREVARKARVIEDAGTPVVILFGRGKTIVEDIRSRPVSKERPRFDRHDLRRLQRFMVNLRQLDLECLLALKQLSPLLPNMQLYVLADSFYHKDLGVLIKQRPTEDFVQ